MTFLISPFIKFSPQAYSAVRLLITVWICFLKLKVRHKVGRGKVYRVSAILIWALLLNNVFMYRHSNTVQGNGRTFNNTFTFTTRMSFCQAYTKMDIKHIKINFQIWYSVYAFQIKVIYMMVIDWFIGLL